MLERGTKQGVQKGMSVEGPQGVVGVVVEVGDNYSKVMSLLHRNSRVSAMLKKTGSSGDVEWDGSDPNTLVMKKVSKSATVNKGDTVVTSSYSANFPSGLMVGTVVSITPDPATSYNNLRIKTATDFFSLQYVNVIANSLFAEQIALINKTSQKSNE